jgi:glycosyltransferase involved in cell wall biosynthesis
MRMFDASVIICTHNPRQDYLRQVLKALSLQTLPCKRWELLLIDNASDIPLASTVDISWHPNARHFTEHELGIAVARRRGIREALSDLLIFVDDDNVLDPDYLLEAVRIGDEWSMLGAWGAGAIIPRFECEPAEDVRDLLPVLALRDIERPRWTNVVPCNKATPWGAGMCVRAPVATAYGDFSVSSEIQIVSRRGKHILMSGEDVEICYVACEQGSGVGIFPQLKLLHLIPKDRVRLDYLLKVFEGTQTSNLLLAYKWSGTLPQSPLRPRGLMSILKNVIMRRGLERRKYLADVRALIAAREIIKSAKTRP